MSDRFDNWKKPEIEHGKLTEYNWLVQNPWTIIAQFSFNHKMENHLG